MRQGLLVSANVPMEDIWGTPEEKRRTVEAFRHQIELLVRFFGQHQELPLPRLVDLPIGIIDSPQHLDRPWCGAGRAMVAHASDGAVMPCSRYLPISFDQSHLAAPVTPERGRCRFCNFRSACQTCEANNWMTHGNPNDRTAFHCEFTKLQIWGTAQIWAQRAAATLRSLPEAWTAHNAPEGWADKARHAKMQLEVASRVLEQFERHADLADVGMQPGWREAVLHPGPASAPDHPLLRPHLPVYR